MRALFIFKDYDLFFFVAAYRESKDIYYLFNRHNRQFGIYKEEFRWMNNWEIG